jgi:uncharacterized membrane protein YgaE (UPF0421/DUF939 family)
MNDRNNTGDLIEAAVTASLGAGVATSFAVSRGQHPAIALAITIIAALFAVLCRQWDLI